MILQVEFVPQNEMFMYRWFKPKYHDLWYYSYPLSKPIISNKKDHEIIKTLDEPLQNLFIYLTLNGFKTLPSCAGHFLTVQEQYEKYLHVLNDVSQIQNKGLSLKDTETNKKYRYHNKLYSCPWKSFENFKNKLDTHAAVGYFGIIKPPKHVELTQGPIKIYTDKRYFNIPVMHINVLNQKEADIKPNWANVLDIIKAI